MRCHKCKVDNPDDNQFCGKCGAPLIDIPSTPAEAPTETKIAPKKLAIDFAPGQHFGKRYQIIEEIGCGGMGRVYKAVDKELNRIVALKMIKPERSSQPGIVERFKKEIKLASEITHENVCRIHDLGEAEGIKYISMKFIKGENLKELIQTSKRLSVETAIHITEQIVHALIAAHKKGVIHRDLKPHNIMLDRKGNAYVMDFGLAKSFEAKEVIRPDVIIGTPAYMSPEQGERKGVDVRSDIYSLGCVLYEMLAGKSPFEADTSAELIHKHITEIPEPPSKINPQIPKVFEKIILKCLAKKPTKRYQSADEIIKEIDETRQNLISAAKPLKIQKNSIAVLPFIDMSPQKDQKHLCDGMTEEIINALTKVKELRIASRTSAFQFKKEGYNIREIGEKLKVQTVLEGSVRKVGNRLRISAQLINVADGYHLWSDRYDREMDDVFAIQDEISLAIVDNLKVKLLGREKDKLIKRYTRDLDAFNLYLKGRDCWRRRTEENLKKAIVCFQQAAEKDPTYALAYAGIADCYNNLGWYDLLPSKEAYTKARAAAEKAIDIDKALAEAHASLANVIENYGWDWCAAEGKYKKAIMLNPGYATAHHWYALYLSKMGRHDEAIAEAKQAQKLDPLSLIISAPLGSIFYQARQYDRAIEECQKTLEMDPNFIPAHWLLGLAYAQKRMYKQAIAEEQMAIDLSAGTNPIFSSCLGNIYSISGKKEEAKRVLHDLQKLSEQRYVSPYGIALIYVGLDQRDQAFEWLDKAYEERDHWLVWLKVEPLLDSLRSDPKFAALLGKMNLQ